VRAAARFEWRMRNPRPSMTAGTSRSRSLARTPPRHSALGGTLLGVFIGIVVGLGMAASVAYWLMKNNPALPMPSLSRDAPEAVGGNGKVAKTDDKPRFDFYKILPGVEEPKVQPRPERGDRAVVEQAKDRSQNPATNAATKVDAGQTKPASADAARSLAADALKAAVIEAGKSAAADTRTAKVNDRFWLQAGSFSTAPDAENLRARLALAGWEASVQEGALPDKSVRYRVRLGPYDNTDELTRMKSELAKRGFDVAVIHY
jgi:cell division protein FtsN